MGAEGQTYCVLWVVRVSHERTRRLFLRCHFGCVPRAACSAPTALPSAYLHCADRRQGMAAQAGGAWRGLDMKRGGRAIVVIVQCARQAPAVCTAGA